MNKVLSFEQEFERSNPGRIQILRFMREAIGVDEVEWQHLTTLNLTKVQVIVPVPISLF